MRDIIEGKQRCGWDAVAVTRTGWGAETCFVRTGRDLEKQEIPSLACLSYLLRWLQCRADQTDDSVNGIRRESSWGRKSSMGPGTWDLGPGLGLFGRRISALFATNSALDATSREGPTQNRAIGQSGDADSRPRSFPSLQADLFLLSHISSTTDSNFPGLSVRIAFFF